MGGSDDTRAVSEVMGAILVFSLLVTALGAYQAVIVPNQNEEVEFKHNQEVQKDFLTLRNSIHQSSTDGEDASVAVDLGVRYPTRALTLNPPPEGGTLRVQTTSGSTDDLEVQNAKVEQDDTGDYWDGSTKSFTTGLVEFEPGYNLYRDAPTTKIENGVIYNHFPEDSEFIPLSNQRVVSGRQINLVALDGDISKSQVGDVAVDVNSVSAAETRVPVTNTAGDNVVVRIPTTLSEEQWVGQLLDEQIDDDDDSHTVCADIDSPAADSDPDKFIQNCNYVTGSEFNVLELTMEPGKTYTLNLAKVSVGENAAEPDAHYITTVAGGEGSLVDIERRELTFQVRDQFDNPVSGVEVPLEATEGEFEGGSSTKTATTDEHGRITVTFLPDDVPDGGSETATITAGGSLDLDAVPGPDFDPDGDGPEAHEEAEFEFTVVDSEADTDVGGSVNPSGPIVLSDARTSGERSGAGNSIDCEDDNSNCVVELTFDHVNPPGEDWAIKQLRYHFYIAPGAPGIGVRDAPAEEVQIWDHASCSTNTYQFQDDYQPATQLGTVTAGGTKTLSLNFENPPDSFQTIQGDGFFITIEFESVTNPSNTFIATYFASPVKDTSIENPCN